MKIMLLTSHLKIGGIGIYTATLANCLARKGHTVFVASYGGELESQFSSGVRIIKVPLDIKSVLDPKVIAAAFILSGVVRKEGIDIIHAHTRVAQFTAQLISIVTGTPYVTTWHGFYRPHFFRRLIPCWGERTIAISRSVYDNLRDAFKRDEARIRLILNGIDLSKFSRIFSAEEKLSLKKRFGLGSGPVIGIISRLSPEKGLLSLLEAFKEVLTAIPDVQLVIVGEGRMESELKNRAKELGIKEATHFFGSTLDTVEFLAIMDIFARPGTKEGFGLVVAEAMLMGVPVVSTDVGGFKDMLEEVEIGVLVEPNDTEHLSRALLRVLTDRNLAEKIKVSARRYAELNFSAEEMAKKTLNVYKEILDE